MTHMHAETRRRGDTYPLQIAVKDAAGTAIDITGHSFTLVVDPLEAPPNADNNLFSVTGSIIDEATGRVDFAISTANADQTTGTYFFEAQMTDTGDLITTIIKGTWRVEQDIVK